MSVESVLLPILVQEEEQMLKPKLNLFSYAPSSSKQTIQVQTARQTQTQSVFNTNFIIAMILSAIAVGVTVSIFDVLNTYLKAKLLKGVKQ